MTVLELNNVQESHAKKYCTRLIYSNCNIPAELFRLYCYLRFSIFLISFTGNRIVAVNGWLERHKAAARTLKELPPPSSPLSPFPSPSRPYPFSLVLSFPLTKQLAARGSSWRCHTQANVLPSAICRYELNVYAPPSRILDDVGIISPFSCGLFFFATNSALFLSLSSLSLSSFFHSN